MNKSIIRIYRRTKPFVQIDTKTIRNPELSLRAKGLLAIMLSFDDGWEFHTKQIAEMSSDKITSHMSAMRELVQAKHVQRKSERDKNGKFIRYIIKVYEIPLRDTAIVFTACGQTACGQTAHKNINYKNIKTNVSKPSVALIPKNNTFGIKYGQMIQNILKIHSKYRPVSPSTWAKQINYIINKMHVEKGKFRKIIKWYLHRGHKIEYSPRIFRVSDLVDKWYKIEEAKSRDDKKRRKQEPNMMYRKGPDGKMGFYDDSNYE